MVRGFPGAPDDLLGRLLEAGVIFKGSAVPAAAPGDAAAAEAERAGWKMQRRLQELVNKFNLQRLVASLPARARRQLASSSSFPAGAWLYASGGFRATRMSDVVFAPAVRLRLDLPLGRRPAAGAAAHKCRWCSTVVDHYDLSDHIQLCMSRKGKAQRNGRHSAVLQAFSAIVGSTGGARVFSKNGAVRNVVPGADELARHWDRGKFADGTLYSPVDQALRQSVDVTVRFPAERVPHVEARAGAAADAGEAFKTRFYGTRYPDLIRDKAFIPFGVDSFGSLGSSATSTLKMLATLAATKSRRAFKTNTLANLHAASVSLRHRWMLQRLAVALQTANALTMIRFADGDGVADAQRPRRAR